MTNVVVSDWSILKCLFCNPNKEKKRPKKGDAKRRYQKLGERIERITIQKKNFGLHLNNLFKTFGDQLNQNY